MVEALDFESILRNWHDKRVLQIYDRQTLSIPDGTEASIKRQRDILKAFFIQFFWDVEFEKHFGFSRETWESDNNLGCFPAKFCLTPLIKLMVPKYARLFFRVTPGGELEELPICNSLNRHFEIERIKRRDQLGLEPKMAAAARKKGKLSEVKVPYMI